MSTILTIIVPEAHMAKANHLGMCKGYSEADGLSYRGANWEDGTGNLYSSTSLMDNMFAADPWSPCETPEWDTEGVVDVTQASQAQAMLTVWTPNDETQEKPTLEPDKIIIIRGLKPLDALAMMGLEPVPQDGEADV